MIDREDGFVEIDIMLMLKAIWHYAWAVILAVAVCAAGGFFYADKFIPVSYSTSTTVYVNNTYSYYRSEGDVNNYKNGEVIATSKNLVETYMEVVRTTETLDQVIQRTGLHYSAAQMAGMIATRQVEETEMFKVIVTCYNPRDAVLIANTIADVLPDRMTDIFKGSSTRIVQPAIAAYKSGPRRMKYLLVGALIGFLCAALVIVIRELRDDKIYGEDYIEDVSEDVPVLASIPDLKDTRAFAKNYYYGKGYGYGSEDDGKKKDKKRKSKKKDTDSGLTELEKDKLILCENLDFTASESYKVLRTNLTYHLNELGRGGKVIGVVSSDRREGKSTTAINLSYVFAQTGVNVMTIEGDLRLPAVAKRLDIEPSAGLSDVISGVVTNDMIHPSGKLDNWFVMTSGSKTNNPSEILGNEKIGQIMSILKERMSIIIVDLPPINEVTDAMAIAPYLDSVVFVVKQNETRKVAFNMALRQLKLAGAPLTGFVLVNATGTADKYDKYGKYGKYGRYSKHYKYDRYGKYGKYGRYDQGYNSYGYRDDYGYGYGYREP